jgi:hypothetical protein
LVCSLAWVAETVDSSDEMVDSACESEVSREEMVDLVAERSASSCALLLASAEGAGVAETEVRRVPAGLRVGIAEWLARLDGGRVEPSEDGGRAGAFEAEAGVGMFDE